MRASTIAMIGFAVVFGLLAVFIAQVWLNNQANMRAKNLDANRPQMACRRSSSQSKRCVLALSSMDQCCRRCPGPPMACRAALTPKSRTSYPADDAAGETAKYVLNNIHLLEESYRRGKGIQ